MLVRDSCLGPLLCLSSVGRGKGSPALASPFWYPSCVGECPWLGTLPPRNRLSLGQAVGASCLFSVGAGVVNYAFRAGTVPQMVPHYIPGYLNAFFGWMPLTLCTTYNEKDDPNSFLVIFHPMSDNFEPNILSRVVAPHCVAMRRAISNLENTRGS